MQGVIIYMSIYVAMTLGTFACILAMRRDTGPVEEIADLAGLGRTKPAMAFFLAMMLFSLAGIPPLAGFFAKFYVFLAAVNAGLYTLAVIGVLASVVGAYYYLLIVKVMYFDEPAPAFEPMRGELRAVLAVTGLFVILFFVYPAPLVDAAAVGREVAVLIRWSCTRTRSPRGLLVSFETLGSTNAEALARGRAGAAAPLWIIAAEQTAGRGRRGRPWVSATGNLHASLLLVDPAPLAQVAQVSFVAALALHDALVETAPALSAAPDAEMAERRARRRVQARRHPDRRGGIAPAPRRHRHRRQLPPSSRRDRIPRHQPGGRSVRPSRPPTCSRRCPGTWLPGCGNGTGDAASRRSGTAGWRVPSRPVRRCGRGCPTGSSPAVSKRSTRMAVWCCGGLMAACARSRPATCFR